VFYLDLTCVLLCVDSLEEFQAPRHPKIEEMGDRTIPFGKEVYIEREDFFDLEGPEGENNGGRTPKGFKRLLPGDKVRLRYAYVIQCDEVVRDSKTNEPVELKCTYYPETRAGVTPEGMDRVKGIIHWVEASTGVSCKVNQYDRLFVTDEPGKESGDFLADMNPDSLAVLEGVMVEPSVVNDVVDILKQIEENKGSEKLYPANLSYQFERSGYFALDKTTTGKEDVVFNRVVTLRDTWGANKEEENKQAGARTRGRGAEKKKAAPPKEGGGGGGAAPVEDIRRIAFRAATILEASPHPEADSLLLCKVDCGDVAEDGSPEPRTVVAGLAGKIPIDELVGRKVVAVTNLKPAKMRGIESTAMLLAASDGKEGDDETVELLQVPDSVPNGELLNLEGKDASEPDPMMKSKGALKAFDRAMSGVKANENGEASYVDEDGSVYRLVTSAGPVKTKTLKDSVIQ
jgi:methionine--tRNA ligase beta chain